MNLYFIGYCCTGKTSVGKYLAGVIKRPFIGIDMKIAREEDKATFDNRPSLSDKGVIAEIEKILSQREPLYKKAADLSIDTNGKKIEEIGNSILKELKNFRHFRHFSAF